MPIGVPSNNVYPDAANELEDRSAILITTGRFPRVNISIENVSLSDGHLDIYLETETILSDSAPTSCPF